MVNVEQGGSKSGQDIDMSKPLYTHGRAGVIIFGARCGIVWHFLVDVVGGMLHWIDKTTDIASRVMPMACEGASERLHFHRISRMSEAARSQMKMTVKMIISSIQVGAQARYRASVSMCMLDDALLATETLSFVCIWEDTAWLVSKCHI